MATFVNDTFTDTAATNLTSHTGETGATWAKHASYTGDAIITDANRARPDSAGLIALYYASGSPASAEYDVQATARFFSSVSSTWLGVIGRLDTGADTFYVAYYDQDVGAWRLHKRVAGSQTELGTAYSQVLSAGNDYVLKLEIRNATKKVFIDGVERISDSDNSITAAGKSGIYGFPQSSNSTGIHWADFSAADPAGSGGGGYVMPRWNSVRR